MLELQICWRRLNVGDLKLSDRDLTLMDGALNVSEGD